MAESSLQKLIALVLCTILSVYTFAAARIDTGCSGVDREAREWIEKMSHSLRETNYRGIFTYEHGSHMESLSIDHRVKNGFEQEQLTRLDGEARKVVRKEHPLSCIHPGHRLVRLSEQLKKDGCGLPSYYRLSISGDERVAGRDAIQLRVIPRDMYRYGYQLALDRQSALLLKSQVMGQNGQVLERFQFSDLDLLGEQPKDNTENFDGLAEHHLLHSSQSNAEQDPWLIDWVPPGFMLAADTSITEQLASKTYTDGLAVFSVMVEPSDRRGANQDGEGRAQQGATVAYTRVINIGLKVFFVTVIGEVPVDTAKRVAASVGLRG